MLWLINMRIVFMGTPQAAVPTLAAVSLQTATKSWLFGHNRINQPDAVTR